MDDLGWRDCLGANGNRLRISASHELFERVCGAPRQEADGAVLVTLRMRGATQWLWAMLDECYPGWEQVGDASAESTTVRLSPANAQGFMAEHLRNATASAAPGVRH